INGLIWMGDKDFMRKQIESKIEEGFRCLKLKIGAIDFEAELSLLRMIRSHFSKDDLEIRVDANGAFHSNEALDKLGKLSRFHLHSIEQPIKQGNWEAMSKLCKSTPLSIALDEELIGIESKDKYDLINAIQPQYIILKPTLVGGYKSSEEWIALAESKDVGWWITSALESNVGLNAIAQWTYKLNTTMPQGLGTGGLFTNNFSCPLMVKNATLHYEPTLDWDFNI
ncbi:o-succinylbenzoate synthase, partial [Aegicerativicinus sediminis]